ncbi:MAG TPA: glycosyltransferase [Thermoanaerobaculia bacterium]|nr:glycosyltransferase [Thermoanaerobaculia bacterium]
MTGPDLEAELARTRRRLETKERELDDIHRSRAWQFVVALRSLKYKLVDPVLGVFGISWPRRRSAAHVVSDTIAPARNGKYDVICLSTCEWNARFQRPQQLLSQFADAGHRVFYVSPHFGHSQSIRHVRPNLYEVTFAGEPLNVYADSLDARNAGVSPAEQGASRSRPENRGETPPAQPARRRRSDALFDALNLLRTNASIDTAAMIVQLPFWWPLARRAREQFGWPVIYDCMDLHSGFSTVRRAMVAQEEELLANADVVVVSSALLERRALQHRESAVMVRNACDYDHFARVTKADNARPVIGYYGAISDWFDSALVADLAARRPDWDFVLIGSTYNAAISRLVKLPNVSLPGEEPYEWLPEQLSRFDIAIIPFKRTPLTEATNPVKVYEMLAAGLPVVAAPIPEVAALAPLVRVASTAEEFEQQIIAALADDDDTREARRAFAREQTWQHRFAILANATADAMSRA